MKHARASFKMPDLCNGIFWNARFSCRLPQTASILKREYFKKRLFQATLCDSSEFTFKFWPISNQSHVTCTEVILTQDNCFNI